MDEIKLTPDEELEAANGGKKVADARFHRLRRAVQTYLILHYGATSQLADLIQARRRMMADAELTEDEVGL